MNKHLLTFIIIIGFVGFVAPCFASEVFVNIDFSDVNEMYRIKTDDQENRSVGLLFFPDNRFEGYFIDKFRNHRFIRVDNSATNSKELSYIEEFYRGEPIYKAFDKPFAKFDSSLKHYIFMKPELNNRVDKIVCYCWHEDNKGYFIVDGEKVSEIKPAVESKDKNNRFVCFGISVAISDNYYVLGTDILKDWLKKYGMSTEKSECSKVAFLSMPKSQKTLIYIYSKPENCVYRFIIDEAREFKVGLPKKYEIDFAINSMTISEDGTLYAIAEVVEKPKPTLDDLDEIEMETNLILSSSKDSDILLADGSKEHNEEALANRIKLKKILTTDAECQIVLSRAYYQYFYELPFGEDEFEKLEYSLFLGKNYYSAKLSLKHISLATLDSDLYTLTEVAKRKGNHIDEIVEGAPGFSNSFKKPLGYHIAVKENL